MGLFYQKNLGMAGGVNTPEPIWSDEIYCTKCNKEAKIISSKKRSWRSYEYEETYSCYDVVVKCIKCNIQGKMSVDYGVKRDESTMEKYGYRGANY